MKEVGRYRKPVTTCESNFVNIDSKRFLENVYYFNMTKPTLRRQGIPLILRAVL